MSRPQSKVDLLDEAPVTHEKMLALVSSLSPEQREAEFSFEDRDRNLRDVLIHLHEWHLLLLTWVEANIAGDGADFLPEGYTWADFAGLNVEFRDKHAETPVDEAQALYEESWQRVISMIEQLSDEELFTKQYFEWTGTTSVGKYCVSATVAHDDWAMKKLRQHLRG